MELVALLGLAGLALEQPAWLKSSQWFTSSGPFALASLLAVSKPVPRRHADRDADPYPQRGAHAVTKHPGQEEHRHRDRGDRKKHNSGHLQVARTLRRVSHVTSISNVGA